MKSKVMIEGLPLSGESQPAQALVTVILSLYLSLSLIHVSLQQQQQLCRASIQHSSSLPNLFSRKRSRHCPPSLMQDTCIYTHIDPALK